MIVLDSIHDERILEFTSLRDKVLLNNQEFIAETSRVVQKALECGYEAIKILCTEEYFINNQDALTSSCEYIYTLSKKEIQNVVGFKIHHEVLALLKKKPFSKLEELGNKILIFNGVTSPENIGTIVRASLAFNFDSIIFDNKSASPFLRRCVRVSMGNVFSAQVYKSMNLRETITLLQNNNYEVIATANEEGAESLLDYIYPEKVCIIIGSEGHGIDREILNISSKKIFIPVNSFVNHLNAASAASIFLYHSLITKESP